MTDSAFDKSARSKVPDAPLTVVSSLAEPPAMAAGMTVSRIHSILRQAEGGWTRDLFALYRDIVAGDAHLQTEVMKRKLAVLGDAMVFLPADKTNAKDVDTSGVVSAAVAKFRGWRRACSALLDGSLWPVSVVEKVFVQEGTGFEIRALIQVPYQLLDFTTGTLRIFDVDDRGMPLTSTHEVDPNRYIVHRGHLLSTPDNWGGPLRAILFWWLLSSMDVEWWARFLDKYGTPFLLGTYREAEGRSVLERAFALATKLGGLVVSEGTTAEIKQAAASDSAAAYEKFLAICQREKSKLVLGQTLSSEAQPTGLGEGTSKMQEGVRQDIRKFDATLLAETLRDQLFVQYCAINRMSGQPPKIAFGSDSVEEIASTADMLKSLGDAGLEPTDDAIGTLSERVGFGLQRKAGGAPAFGAFAARPASVAVEHAVDTVSRAGAADIAQAFRGSLAPVRRIILSSRSPGECERRIREFYADWSPGKLADLLSNALEAFSANGAATAAAHSAGGRDQG